MQGDVDGTVVEAIVKTWRLCRKLEVSTYLCSEPGTFLLRMQFWKSDMMQVSPHLIMLEI